MAKKPKAQSPHHANTDEHRNALPGGFRLHWYEIGKVLGQGGFGITYLAQDLNLDQAVAIKEYLPSELAVRGEDWAVHPISKERAPTFAWGLARFISEGKTLAKFKHPNIVSVYSLFEANNTGYMVMAYEHGASLETVLGQRRTIPEPELHKILLSLLAGLERVHQAGFIHRDIKPANIVIRSDGTPALIDFGSARQAFAGYTRTLTTLVSPGYAPFEQYASEGERQGPWTDIYALGATVYRAITGKTPADAIARNVVLKGQPDPMRPAAEIGKGWYSPHFLEAIDCALAFQEEDRPQSIAEWRQMLLGKREVKAPQTPLATGIPTMKVSEFAETTPTTPLAPPTEKPRAPALPAPAWRRPKWLAVTAVLALVVGTLSYQFVIRQDSPPPVDKTVEQATPAPRALEEKAESPEEEIQELVAKAEADMQASRLTSPAGSNALERYRAVLALDPDNLQAQQGLQQIVGAYLKLVAKARDAQQFDKAEQYLQRAEAIGPNAEDIQHARARLLATKVQLEREITIKRLLAKAEEDIKATRLTSPKGNNALERFRAVLAVDPDNVKAKQGIARLVDQYVELAGKAIAAKQFTKAERYLHNAAAVQPDAAQVQAARMQLAERRAQAEARLKAEIEQQRKAQLQARREAEAKRQAELEAKRIEDLRTVRTLTGHAHRVQAVAFSPDGRTLASGSWDQTIKLWDTSSGRLQRTLADHADIVLAVAFSPDGRTLASASRDKTIKLRDVSSGRLQRTLTGHAKPAIAIAFSPDGRTLASGSADKTIKLWDTSSGRLQRTLTGHAHRVRAVAFSPDGRTLASASWDQTIKLWDTSSGRLQRTLTGHADIVRAVAFSPDGRTLASASRDKTIKLWDTSSGRLQRTLTGHAKSVLAVAFSPEGRTLASGSADKTIKLWDTSSGRLQRTLTGHADIVRAVAFSPDGRTLASGSYDNTIKLWQ